MLLIVLILHFLMTIAPSITATDTPSSPILMLWIDTQYEILTFFGLVVRHSLKTDDFSSIYLTFLLASRGKIQISPFQPQGPEEIVINHKTTTKRKLLHVFVMFVYILQLFMGSISIDHAQGRYSIACSIIPLMLYHLNGL